MRAATIYIMKNSKIAWTDHTFNPWIGCTKVSPGCLNCYAESLNERWHHGENWGRGAPRKRTSAAYWKQPLAWNHDALEAEGIADNPKHPEFRRSPRVFCASLADWLDEETPIGWLADLIDLIRRTPALNWLLLTKRPDLFFYRMSIAVRYSLDIRPCEGSGMFDTADMIGGWVRGDSPRNVWVGTSVEDQARADKRVPLLLDIPARVRFLSCEPLLECVSLRTEWFSCTRENRSAVDWVIAGGESGPRFREMRVGWATQLRDQCTSARIPFFMKQLGGHPNKRHLLSDFPEHLRMQDFPVV